MGQMDQVASRLLQFDRFALDLSRGCVRLGGRDIDLSPKAFAVLRLLAENAGRLVSKQELYDAVWPGVIVTDESLVQRIRELRQVLGDDDHSLIKTLSRRGYLLDTTPQQRSEELPSDAVAAGHAVPIAVPLAPERRQLSIMMCDTIGSAAFIKHQDPEDLSDVLAACHRRVKEVIDRFGGFIAEYRVGRILAYFGYPTAHENDAERAIRAALAVTAAVAEMHFECLDRPLQPRVGIATGLVVVGDIIGAAAAGEHAVAGETPQLAGDMLAAAEPGAVVISAGTRQLIGSLFECSIIDTPRTSAARQFEAHRVWRESKGGSRFEALRSVQTQFIGRDEELALLLRRWRQAKTGEGRVVLVWGEPGIGKSRLMDRFLEALRQEDHLSAWFWCWPHRTETALHPVIAYIENAAAIEVADAPESKLEKLEMLFSTSEQAVNDTVLFADLLGISVAGRHPPLAISSQRRKELLLERFIAHLAQLASRQPILIVLEDAHWIDPTTRELFDIVIERVVRLPILFIMTYRPEFSPPWIGQSHVTALTLNRLGSRESLVMIKEVAAGRLLSSDVLEQIAVHTDGVPLFIEEMTKSVLEGAASSERASEEPRLMAVPATLQASLVARLDRLAPARTVAQTAAAIGRDFTYATLKAVTALGDEDLERLLSQLVASELVHQRGVPPHATYYFKHALVQDAAYQTVLKSERIRIHRRIAEVLEREFPETAQRSPEIIGYHFTQARMWEKAIGYWLAAARMALDRSAGAEAQGQVEKGMALLPEIDDSSLRRQLEGRLQAALGNTFAMTKGFASPDVLNSLARARTLLNEEAYPVEALSALCGLFNYHLMRSEAPAGLKLAHPLLARSADRATRVIAHYLVGAAYLHMGDFRKSEQHLEQSRSLYDEEVCRSVAFIPGYHIHSFALIWLGLARLYAGSIHGAKEAISLAVTDARNRSHPFTLTSALLALARFCNHLRDLDGSLAATEEGLAIAVEQRSPYHVSRATVLRAVNLIEGGQPHEGIALMESALSAHRQTGANYQSSYNLSYLALAYSRIGDIQRSLEIATQAIEEIERTGERWWEPEAHRIKGEILLLTGEPRCDEAVRCFQTALECARRQQAKIWELRAARSLGKLRISQGRKVAAKRLLKPIYEQFSGGPEFADFGELRTLLRGIGP